MRNGLTYRPGFVKFGLAEISQKAAVPDYEALSYNAAATGGQAAIKRMAGRSQLATCVVGVQFRKADTACLTNLARVSNF